MTPTARAHAGLCADCAFARVTFSDRGSAFYQCLRSFEDPRFTKYPRLPMRHCVGYVRQSPEPDSGE